MNYNDQLEELRRVAPGAELWFDAGLPVIFLPDLIVDGGFGTKLAADGLLWPHARDGYPTRFYLSQRPPWPISGGEWRDAVVQGRSWHACSWGEVQPTRPWLEMLSDHLRAFKCMRG